MKYFIILASGLADEPVQALGGQTPLEAARRQAMDELSRRGKTGLVEIFPDDLPMSEEVALLSALGYDPHKYFRGEASLSLADSGLRPTQEQVAFMHNMVTESDGKLIDHAAGQITAKESEALLTSLHAALGRPEIMFSAQRGFSGLSLLPFSHDAELECLPPEEALGLPLEKCLPKEAGSDIVRKVMETSREVFKEHEVNRVRTDLGENPADMLWLWGPGRETALPDFQTLRGLRAAMVAAPGSARGLGLLCQMKVPHVAGATGGYQTDYSAKARCALEMIESCDIVVVHLAAPAEVSLEGNVQKKVASIEQIDALIVAPLLNCAIARGDTRVLFLPTHAVSCASRKRLRIEVPVAMFGPGVEPLRENGFTESTAATGELQIKAAHELLEYFLTR